MSSRPIGKIIPEAAPSFLVQLLIPESDGFRAQEVSIPVEGLIPSIASGNYTPEYDTLVNLDGLNMAPSFYQKVGNVVAIQGYARYESIGAGMCSFNMYLPFLSMMENKCVCQTTTEEGTANFSESSAEGTCIVVFSSLVAGIYNVSFVVSYEITQ
jgi:hypothetical protein